MWASRSLQLNGTYGYFFAVYGLFSELAEGAERALVIDLVPDEWRGRALGAYQAAFGIAMLSASMAFGVIYEYAGAKPAFILGAVLALTAIPILPPQGADQRQRIVLLGNSWRLLDFRSLEVY